MEVSFSFNYQNPRIKKSTQAADMNVLENCGTMQISQLSRQILVVLKALKLVWFSR